MSSQIDLLGQCDVRHFCGQRPGDGPDLLDTRRELQVCLQAGVEIIVRDAPFAVRVRWAGEAQRAFSDDFSSQGFPDGRPKDGAWDAAESPFEMFNDSEPSPMPLHLHVIGLSGLELFLV